MSKFVVLEEYEYGEFHPVMINVDKIVGLTPIVRNNTPCEFTLIYADGFHWEVKGTFDEISNKIKHVLADNTKYNIKF